MTAKKGADADDHPGQNARLAADGTLIQAAPQIFGEVMGELFGLIAAGVLTPEQPTVYDLGDGPKALAELESRATVGKLALVP